MSGNWSDPEMQELLIILGQIFGIYLAFGMWKANHQHKDTV